MPILESHEKGNLYITMKVKIPDFSDEELDQLEGFFKKMKTEWVMFYKSCNFSAYIPKNQWE